MTDADQNIKTQQAEMSAKGRKPAAPLTAQEEWGELFRTAIIAVVLALIVRTFLLEPFNIPSGSMKPTLEVGDYLFVSKPAYGYSRFSFPFGFAPIEGRIWTGGRVPQRGDVVVFKKPTDTSTDYIKRLIGLPGDTIQMINGRLYINHKMVPRQEVGLKDIDESGRQMTVMEYLETLPNGVVHYIYEISDDQPLDNTEEFLVPEGHYFMMGDNRDDSQDSRVMSEVGYVPLENFVGKASLIFFSTNGYAELPEFWKWPWSVRYNRMLLPIRPVRMDAPSPSVDKAQPAPAGTP
jgi:signal peptidase I